jgi:hypothetical protein
LSDVCIDFVDSGILECIIIKMEVSKLDCLWMSCAELPEVSEELVNVLFSLEKTAKAAGILGFCSAASDFGGRADTAVFEEDFPHMEDRIKEYNSQDEVAS